VVEAVDGQDALEKLAQSEFNLIVSDVNMPRMDGLTFAVKAKEVSLNKFTPIIMLTTENQEDKMTKGMEAGVRAWLTKPFRPEQLLGAVNRLIV
jgi:two-component system chemotaxis response regulator CheY